MFFIHDMCICLDLSHVMNEEHLRDEILRDAVVAMEVTPEDQLISQMEKMKNESSNPPTFCQKYGAFCGCLLLIAIVAIVLGTTLPNRYDHDDKNLLKGYPYLFELISSSTVSTKEQLLNETLPQYKALHWLAYEDTIPNLPLDSTVEDERYLIERYALAVLYFATGGVNSGGGNSGGVHDNDDIDASASVWLDEYNFLSNTSVCEWPPPLVVIGGVDEAEEEEEEESQNGIRCDKDGYVTKVQISKYTLLFLDIVIDLVLFENFDKMSLNIVD